MSYMSYLDTRQELVILMETEQQLTQAIDDLTRQRAVIREFVTAEIRREV